MHATNDASETHSCADVCTTHPHHAHDGSTTIYRSETEDAYLQGRVKGCGDAPEAGAEPCTKRNMGPLCREDVPCMQAAQQRQRLQRRHDRLGGRCAGSPTRRYSGAAGCAASAARWTGPPRLLSRWDCIECPGGAGPLRIPPHRRAQAEPPGQQPTPRTVRPMTWHDTAQLSQQRACSVLCALCYVAVAECVSIAVTICTEV